MHYKTLSLILFLLIGFFSQAQETEKLEQLLTNYHWTSCGEIDQLEQDGEPYHIVLKRLDTTQVGQMCWYGTTFYNNGRFREVNHPMCGTPPYRSTTIMGKWELKNGKFTMIVTNANGNCRDENEAACEKFERNLKKREGQATVYQFDIFSDKLIAGRIVEK